VNLGAPGSRQTERMSPLTSLPKELPEERGALSAFTPPI